MAAEIFQKSPCFLEPATCLFDIILETGKIAYQMFGAMDKPRKGPRKVQVQVPHLPDFGAF